MAKYFIYILILTVILGWSSGRAQSEPLILLSWQAKNFAPAGFQGKNLPIINTPIVVGLDLIEKSQLVNLKNYEIRWYLDGNFADSGKGMTIFEFRGGKLGGADEHSIRAEIIDYNGQNLTKNLSVPLVKPQIVIVPPYQINGAPAVKFGDNYFEALPYFFNVGELGNLEINWDAAGVRTQGETANQNVLNLQIPTSTPNGLSLPIKVIIKNKNQPLEIYNQTINATVIQ